MDREQGLLRQIILWLWVRNRKSRATLSDKKIKDLYDLVMVSYQEFQDRELEALIPKNNAPSTLDLTQENKYIFLEPEISCNMVPLLSFKYDFTRSKPIVRLYLALFFMDKSDIHAVGYRFETPEGEGVHDYYHAQWISRFGRQDLPNCPSWIPKKQPALTLDAENCVALLICLLISIYGLDYLDILEQAEFWGFAKESVGKMFCNNNRPIFLQARKKGELRYFKTWHESSRANLILKNRGYTDIVKINRKLYNTREWNEKEYL